MIKTADRVIGMLPYEMQDPNNSINLKKILGIYGDIVDLGDEFTQHYRDVLDIYGAVGQEIDFIGAMYDVFRISGEQDEPYRERIITTIVKRKTPTTIVELQQAVDSIVTVGKLYVMENHNDRACNVYLTGTADEDSIRRSISLIRNFLPAGVYALIPIVSFATWQNVKDQFDYWSSLKKDDIIW